MKFEPNKHHRRSIRIKGYDYAAAGGYFVTIVTQGRACLFGEIRGQEMQLSPRGLIAEENWRAIPDHFATVELGAYVVMPNHIHGIIILHERTDTDAFRSAILSPTVGATQWVAPTNGTKPIAHTIGTEQIAPTIGIEQVACTKPTIKPNGPKRGSIGAIIGAYKMSVTRKIVEQYGGVPDIWQRNYYEHIIRDEADHNRIHLYIESNPVQWMNDDENPERQP